MRHLFIFAILLACSFLSTSSVFADVTVSATMSPATLTLNEYGRLTINIDGTKSADIDIPEVKGLDIIYRGQNSRINIINGKYSSSLTATYTIHPQETGNFTIPAIKVITDKTTLTTEPIDFKVENRTTGTTNPQGATSASPTGSGKDATPYMVIEKLQQAHYVGEVVPITIKAYFPKNIRISQVSYPRLIGEGCVIPQLQADPIQQHEVINGKPYTALTWNTELTPVKEGNHSLHLEMDAVQIVPQKRTSTSFFDSPSPFGNDLFDDFFGTVRKKELRVTSEPQMLKALPLPEAGRPADFKGAVGEFSIKTEVSPQQAEVGEPLTLRITIQGSGNMDGVESPELPESKDWKAYSPTLLENTRNQTADKRVFEQAIVARNSNISEVPALHFSYFNPKTKQYHTVNSSPLPLTITGNNTTPAPAVPPPAPVVEKPTVKPKPVLGIAPLHHKIGKTVSAITPIFKKTIYLIIITVLCILLVASLIYYRYKQSVSTPEKIAQKRLTSFRESIRDLEKRSEQAPPQQSLAELRDIIREQLGAIWNCPPEAITRGDILQKLEHDAPGLIRIFDSAEASAYGGPPPDRTTMNGYLETAKKELEKIL